MWVLYQTHWNYSLAGKGVGSSSVSKKSVVIVVIVKRYLLRSLLKAFQIKSSLPTETCRSAGACCCKLCHQGKDKSWFQPQGTEEYQGITKTCEISLVFRACGSVWCQIPYQEEHVIVAAQTNREEKIGSYNLMVGMEQFHMASFFWKNISKQFVSLFFFNHEFF